MYLNLAVKEKILKSAYFLKPFNLGCCFNLLWSSKGLRKSQQLTLGMDLYPAQVDWEIVLSIILCYLHQLFIRTFNRQMSNWISQPISKWILMLWWVLWSQSGYLKLKKLFWTILVTHYILIPLITMRHYDLKHIVILNDII